MLAVSQRCLSAQKVRRGKRHSVSDCRWTREPEILFEQYMVPLHWRLTGDTAAGPDSPPEAAATAHDGTAHDGTAQDSGRTEAGGGFGGVVLPSGAYVVRDGQVRWVPAVDVTLAVLASLSLVRMLVRTWTRHRSHRRRR